MPKYSAEFVFFPKLTCHPHGHSTPPTMATTTNAPYAPRLSRTNLPSPDQQPLHPHNNHITDGVYPLDLLATLPLSQQIDMWGIELDSPIHIHTPYAHIGTVHGDFPGQLIPALDVFFLLQDLARKPIDFRSTFNSLSDEMKMKVNKAYRHRSTLALDSNVGDTWDQYAAGKHVQKEPLGIDLLLGNSEVWGFDPNSCCGHSTIHLAGGCIDD